MRMYWNKFLADIFCESRVYVNQAQSRVIYDAGIILER